MPTPRRGSMLLLLPIALIVAAIGALFAWTGGWFGHRGLTPQKMIDTVQASGKPHPGYRRAHSKGICIAGTFAPTPAAAQFSTARVFTQTSTPVLGRFSLGGNDPYGADSKARVRGMGLQLKTDDGQEWRVAMNSFPFFAVKTPEGFQAQNEAMAPDPATGKPDPEKLKDLLKRFPELANFQAWAKSAPWPDSLANTRYNGVNAFQLTDARGVKRIVRWSMRPHAAMVAMTPEQLKLADPDFLGADLDKRLGAGPVQWDMVMQFADAGDAILDPSTAWPESRTEAVVGTLTLNHAEPQVTGPCRDLNFDPLILPTGIAGTADPILRARSAVYSVSFNRRERDISAGKATDAIGKKAPAQ